MAERRTTVAPSPRFYEKFNTSQIIDIVTTAVEKMADYRRFPTTWIFSSCVRNGRQ